MYSRTDLRLVAFRLAMRKLRATSREVTGLLVAVGFGSAIVVGFVLFWTWLFGRVVFGLI